MTPVEGLGMLLMGLIAIFIGGGIAFYIINNIVRNDKTKMQ